VERARHAWNVDFEWKSSGGPFTTISAKQAAAYDGFGYFVFSGAFDADTIAELDAALAPGNAAVAGLLAGAPDGRFSVAGLDTQIVAPHAATRSALARSFCAHPVLAGIARDLIGNDARPYWDQSQLGIDIHSSEPVTRKNTNRGSARSAQCQRVDGAK
jgi:hypothetical protein